MSESATILRKKLAPREQSLPPSERVVEAMMRLMMPREADELMSMDLRVLSVKHSTASKPDLLEGFEEADLIYLLEKEDQRGFCSVSPGVLTALTEMQMSGRVSPGEPKMRVPTLTDGIVAAEMIDRWMDGAVAALSEQNREEELLTLGYRRTSTILNRRDAELALDPVRFRVLSVEMSLGKDAKTGVIAFAVPQAAQATVAVSRTAEQIRSHLPKLRAPMRAILARVPVAFGQVNNLRPGEFLEIPIESISDVRLEGADGALIAPGKLGQLNGFKAVRLTGPSEAKLALPPAAAAVPTTPVAVDQELPDLPKADGWPDLPDLPPLPDGDGLPELPPLPEADGAADTPELPELPPLPDLPELPE